MKSYPHQLSGGMRQRICIATALVTPREILIADEPGTALDVTVQEQIHHLLRQLVDEKERSLIMITHSLGVVRELVDRIYVMYAGNIVESCPASELFQRPLHPYTEGLLECVPAAFRRRTEHRYLRLCAGLLQSPERLPLQQSMRLLHGEVYRRKTRNYRSRPRAYSRLLKYQP